MPASTPFHLILPFARCSGEDWLEAMTQGPTGGLKNLGRLLQRMGAPVDDAGPPTSLSTPHERVLARALGLAGPHGVTDGLIPWAARQASLAGLAAGQAWGFVTPCHWAMGREHATLSDPAALVLDAADSHALLAAMQPYFATEGIVLHYLAPECWLAEGEMFRDLPTASLDRVLGRNVDPWLPGSTTSPQARQAGAGQLRRLQNEMQMLLYTHPLNDRRSAQRLLPVNSVWLSGTGALEAPLQPPDSEPRVLRTLASAAFSGDWQAYARAWAQIDATALADVLARHEAGQAVRLSLCGESDAQTFGDAPAAWTTRFSRRFSPRRPLDVLGQL